MNEFLTRMLSTGRGREEGASAVEYGLLIAGIAALIVTAVFVLGGGMNGSFQNSCDKIKTGGSTAAATCP